MSARTPVPEHRTTGAVFTRPEVVSYMMREVMRAGRFGKWSGLSVLEPSCGDGAFVLPIVDALIAESPDWEDDTLGALRADAKLIRDRPDSARVGSDAWWQHPLSGTEPAACPHSRVEQS
jgi:hypothetical protein